MKYSEIFRAFNASFNSAGETVPNSILFPVWKFQ